MKEENKQSISELVDNLTDWQYVRTTNKMYYFQKASKRKNGRPFNKFISVPKEILEAVYNSLKKI